MMCLLSAQKQALGMTSSSEDEAGEEASGAISAPTMINASTPQQKTHQNSMQPAPPKKVRILSELHGGHLFGASSKMALGLIMLSCFRVFICVSKSK